MDVSSVRAIETFLMPPGGLILLGLLGLLWRRWFGHVVILLALLALYLLSTPRIAAMLASGLESYPALSPEQVAQSGSGAILVPLANQYQPAPEYGRDYTLSRLSVDRLRYAAHLHRKTGLPIALSGGTTSEDSPPLAETGSQVLTEEFGITPLLVETRSQTTWENAAFSAQRLQDLGIRKVAVVTHAWHMPRAVFSVETNGLAAVPAPTYGLSHDLGEPSLPSDWFPQAKSLFDSRLLLHEHVGLIWYRWRQ